ncbi:hypothetical protein Gotur_025973, partial [Gossypium turneri]
VEPFGELCWNTYHSLRYTTSIRPTDLAIHAVIPDEFFQNLNIWHVKVPLVNYATVEMHQRDRVLRQFRFREPIPVAPEGPLNSKRRDDGTGPSTVPTQSLGPSIMPTQSSGPMSQPTTPTSQPL